MLFYIIFFEICFSSDRLPSHKLPCSHKRNISSATKDFAMAQINHWVTQRRCRINSTQLCCSSQCLCVATQASHPSDQSANRACDNAVLRACMYSSVCHVYSSTRFFLDSHETLMIDQHDLIHFDLDISRQSHIPISLY